MAIGLDSALFKFTRVCNKSFLNFYENVSYPISLARGAYCHKSYQTLGDEKNAEKYQ